MPQVAAGIASDAVNPDVSLLRTVNGLARHAPHAVDRVVEAAAGYGLVAVVLLLALCCWWLPARRAEDAPAAVAGTAWAALAAGAAVLLDIPVRALVQRPRPWVEHDGLDVLVHGGGRYSFASAQAAVAAAVAVGLFMVNRRFGALALLAALAEGFAQVYTGSHYPTDVAGGFALGAATALLLAPPALAVLASLAARLTRTRAAFLVRSPLGRPATDGLGPPMRLPHNAGDKDLAA
jgi:undecaprenyl-diphosphatase